MPIPRVLAIAALASLAAGCSATASGDPLAGTTWQLMSIESMAPDEQPSITIDDPSKYTVTFGEDGRVAFQVDCNRGTATWQAEPSGSASGTLTFGPVALTRMFCPQPSADTQVASAHGRVRSYLISDGQLHLSLEADSGVMDWRPAG